MTEWRRRSSVCQHEQHDLCKKGDGTSPAWCGCPCHNQAGMTLGAYEEVIKWLPKATLNQIANLLDTISIKLASTCPDAEVFIRRAAAAARQTGQERET